MFKNYLTYSFTIRFQKSCRLLHIPAHFHQRLLASAEQLVQSFTKSVHTTDRKDELRHLCVALMSLRDCKEVLDQTGAKNFDIEIEYSLLHARLEQLCLKASEEENGQFRMFG